MAKNNEVRDEGKKVHRFVDTSRANSVSRGSREEDTPLMFMIIVVLVCSLFRLQEIEANVLHHVTTARVNNHIIKLAERRAKPVEDLN